MPDVTASNRELVRASFERWQNGTGSPFELLSDDVEWTILGSSPFSKTYRGKEAFLSAVVHPLNKRLAASLMPTLHGLYADGDTVIAFFDAEGPTTDGLCYRNTFSWYLRMHDARVVTGTAFFDTREFDGLWNRITPTS